jgi:hypothetical protein
MAAPETPEEAIEQNTLGPKRVRIGQQEVEQHSIDDQIKADNHLQGKQAAAANRPGLGLRFQQITPVYR